MTVAVLGEALIDFIVAEDGAYRPHLGGSPFNVATSLARQGVSVSYLSPLSDDHFGDLLFNSLNEAGVNLPLGNRSLWPTSLAMVTVDEFGQPSYRLYREGIADKDVSADRVLENLPGDVQIFHTGSLSITPSQLPKIKEIFSELRNRGVLISIDINIRLGASIDTPKYLNGVRTLLPLVDIVKASDEDLNIFRLSPDPQQTADIFYREMEGGMLILTEGAGGALLLAEGNQIRKNGYPISTVVDTIGAGDTFHSAFLAELVRSGNLSMSDLGGRSGQLEQALAFACAAAAINVSRVGCSPPDYKEVKQFLMTMHN